MTSAIRRALVLGVIGALVLPCGVASAAPAGLNGSFSVHFPQGHPASNAPCPADEFCGVGSVVGFGKATITILDESFTEIPGTSCFETTSVEAIDPLSGVGELILDEVGTFCPPGGSGDSNAGPSSYGHPGQWRRTYTVNGSESTGVFAGASGSGRADFDSAGGAGTWRIQGSLTLGG
jgi:hypothetical protein